MEEKPLARRSPLPETKEARARLRSAKRGDFSGDWREEEKQISPLSPLRGGELSSRDESKSIEMRSIMHREEDRPIREYASPSRSLINVRWNATKGRQRGGTHTRPARHFDEAQVYPA